MLLRTLVGLARPRHCLDIGSFTGYASSAVLEAIPAEADLTCLEVEEDFTKLAQGATRQRHGRREECGRCRRTDPLAEPPERPRPCRSSEDAPSHALLLTSCSPSTRGRGRGGAQGRVRARAGH